MEGWARDCRFQATLRAGFEASGIGLHTGRSARVRVLPAPADSGIVIRRLGGGRVRPAEVKAHWRQRRPAYLCTALDVEGSEPIRTVEHLLSSCAAFAVDNAIVELEGDELPIFDGSAVPWCHSILKAGLETQAAPRRYLRISRPVEVREPNGHFLRIEPKPGATGLSMNVSVDFPGFGALQWSGEPATWSYLRDVAPSRSYGLLRWGLPLKMLHLFSRAPLLRGANLFTTGIVVCGRFIGGMHVEDEPVRHRVLDLLGDMQLAGLPMIGHVSGHCPRHDLNHAFVKAVMEDVAAWEIVTLENAGSAQAQPGPGLPTSTSLQAESLQAASLQAAG